MKTIWGEQLDPNAVLQEYPRPQLRRKSYLNLNGYWDYAITNDNVKPERFDGKILVPFSPEAELSGVGRTLLPGQTLWYRRLLPAARESGKRLLLHFGAVDQQAKIYCNGKPVCEHVGGYTAFTVDLTDALNNAQSSIQTGTQNSVKTDTKRHTQADIQSGAPAAENEILVQVRDDTDACALSRGKQKTKRGGIWYTPQSGIWQTVWAEWVPEDYIRALQITPDPEHHLVHWKASCAVPEGINIVVRFEGEVIAEAWTNENGEATLLIRPEYLRLWSPESPFLYDAQLRTENDIVDTYFAMRAVGIGKDADGTPRLMLNGKPYFHHGALDQGYWPDGLYTAPSDEAIIADLQLMKDMGFNMLRKHIKCEPMRWYYHCDRLGILVWQDMMSGGGQYNPITISAPLITHKHKKDNDYQKFARTDTFARAHYYQELRELVEQLYNCPCIVMWVPFNEGWGQFDAEKAVHLIESIDRTRTIDHASGWHDQGIGEIQSLHVYFTAYKYKPDKLGRAVVLSEFGGYHLPVEGHCCNGKSFGYRAFKSSEALGDAVTKLYETQIIPAKQKGLAASVYTQLSDVEDEVNGFVTYDRKCVKLSKELMRKISDQL